MRKKYLNTLIALAVLAAVWGTFTYFDRRASRQASKVETPKEEKIFALDSKHITSITFRPREGEAVTCQHNGGTWAIAEPKKLSADQGTLSTVLNNLTTATVDEVVDPHPSDLKQFGLSPPAYSLEVSTDSNPPKFALLLGDDTPTSGGIYAQVAGNPRVVTLASYLKSNFEKTLFDLRDRRALTLEADQLRKGFGTSFCRPRCVPTALRWMACSASCGGSPCNPSRRRIRRVKRLMDWDPRNCGSC
jgi:hypothetical protein